MTHPGRCPRWLSFCVLLAVCPCVAAQEADPERVLHLDSAAVEWQPVEAPAFPPGMSARPLHRNEDGGGASRIRVEAGFVEPEHYHTTSAHSIYVLSGRVTFAGETGTAGHYFHTPVHVPHALIAETDAELLVWADRALDFVPVAGDD